MGGGAPPQHAVPKAMPRRCAACAAACGCRAMCPLRPFPSPIPPRARARTHTHNTHVHVHIHVHAHVHAHVVGRAPGQGAEQRAARVHTCRRAPRKTLTTRRRERGPVRPRARGRERGRRRRRASVLSLCASAATGALWRRRLGTCRRDVSTFAISSFGRPPPQEAAKQMQASGGGGRSIRSRAGADAGDRHRRVGGRTTHTQSRDTQT
mmetsp:Transcript_73309/g.201329  ORF Transcript_73309/g.201329 Transcript_73309/m.201329 type:complete len:209 (+) Transcript_73309:594-1220(+)|eukprot:2021251-Prymnesium_polylepis.1